MHGLAVQNAALAETIGRGVAPAAEDFRGALPFGHSAADGSAAVDGLAAAMAPPLPRPTPSRP